jgi:signal transduction histidine kinase
LLIAGVFAAFTVALFGLVYWQTQDYLTMRVDGLIMAELDVMAEVSDARRLEAIDERLRPDPRRLKLAGLFDPAGRRRAGNIERLPEIIVLDGKPYDAHVVRLDEREREAHVVRIVARQLPDGEILVLGRNVDERAEIAEIVARALAIGIVPTLALAILVGIVLTRRAERRAEQVTRTAGRIVAGDLRERLQLHQVDDEFDRLAGVINSMLDQIERLVHEIAGVGDDIAHELRTPLTRVRATLERGRANARTIEELQTVVDRAMAGLDRSLAIITALLRIAEIEHRRRLDGFGDADLAGILHEVAELYQPIAEDRQIALHATATPAAPLRGDRDLLFEAVANLIDNAVKYTPPGGHIELMLIERAHDCVIRVTDSGPGIAEADRDAVTRRFYRSDKSRRTPGVGLGLTLVAAIAKLHGFALSISAGPGCVIELVCPRTTGP